MSLDELDRVVRERLIGSPPHDLQHLGTLEKVNYIGTIGRVRRMGTIATLGTVLLTVHIGTIHKVNRLGTLDEMTRAGTLNRIAGGRVGTLARLGTVHQVEGGVLGSVHRLGSVHYQERLGTIQHLGTVRYLQAGSLGRVEHLGTAGRVSYLSKIGTLGYAGRLGTVQYQPRLGSIGHLGTLGARDFSGVGAGFGLGTHVARGSWYPGSWVDISRFYVKTLVVHPSSLSGTIHIMTSVLGNATEHGTYYSERIGKGSYTTKSFTETFKEARAVFQASGSSVTGKGTLRSRWGLQV